MSASNISIHQSIKLYSHNTPQFTSTQPYFSITYTQSQRQSQVHIHIPYKHNLQLSSCLHPYIFIYIYSQTITICIQHQVYIHTYIYRFDIFTQSEVTIQTAQFKTIGESNSRESLTL